MKNSNVSAIRLLMLVVMTTLFSSFVISLGLDSYKVYLNEKLLFEQLAKGQNVQTISLAESSSGDKLTVFYNHCGRIGTSRTLSLMDGDKELKKWKFKDTQTESLSGMSCEVGEIKSLQKPGQTMRLLYNSNELSRPLQVASIAPPNATTAKAK